MALKVNRRYGFVVSRDLPSSKQIQALLRDRPPKFQGPSVGLVRYGGDEKVRCGLCWHWFESPVGKRQVCELVRTMDDSSIKSDDYCLLWTSNGVSYPLVGLSLKGASPSRS